jgi:hypothetical protein
VAAAKPAFPVLRKGHPLAQGLVLALTMHENGGTVVGDLAGQGATASISDPADVTWTAWQAGWCLQCASTTSTTRGVTLSNLAGSGQLYSIGFWWQPAAAGDTYGSILTSGATRGVFHRSTGKLSWYVANTDHLTTFADAVGQWNHAVLAVSVGNYTWYVNGAQDSTGTTASPPSVTAFDTLFNDTASETFVGALDTLLLWNRVLSAAEAAALYADHWQMFRRRSWRLKAAPPAGRVLGPLVSLSPLSPAVWE